MFNMHQIAGGALSPMGFSVYVTDETKEYAPGQQIEFAGTVSNIGQHYQNRSHIFICPVHGLYVFTVSLTSVNDGVPYSAVIIHEGAMLTSVVTHDGNNDQGQALAVTSCYAGERVWVQKQSGTGAVNAHDGSGERLSSFSGYLIKAYYV